MFYVHVTLLLKVPAVSVSDLYLHAEIQVTTIAGTHISLNHDCGRKDISWSSWQRNGTSPNVPTTSMYAILPTFIYHNNRPNVGKYTIQGWNGFVSRNKLSKQTFPTHLPGKHVHHRKLGAVQRSGRFSSGATRDVFQVQVVYRKEILHKKKCVENYGSWMSLVT